MPWKTNNDLPDAIKILPADAQTIWRAAANAHLDKNEGDDEGAVKIGWDAVKNAGFEKGDDGKWKKFDKSSDLHELEFEVFSVGMWNDNKYTDADLENIVKAFHDLKEEVKPFVKLGHDEKQLKDAITDGQPAMGWAYNLRKEGPKLIASFKGVPKVLYEAIKKGLYKRVSSELLLKYKSTSGKIYNLVLSSVAFLGSTIPAVTNLKDLEVYLSQSMQGASFEDAQAISFSVDETGIISVNKENEENEIMENELKEFKDKAAAAELKAKEAEDKLKEFEEKETVRIKAEAELKRKETSESFKKFCEDSVKEGKMTPKGRDILLEKEALQFSDKGDGSVSADTILEFVKTQQKVVEFKEKAKKADDRDVKEFKSANEEVSFKALEYAKTNKVEIGEATIAILGSDKELGERYLNETQKGIEKSEED